MQLLPGITVSGFLNQFHIQLRPEAAHCPLAQDLEELVEAGRGAEGKLVTHRDAFLRQVLVDVLEATACYSVTRNGLNRVSRSKVSNPS